MGELEGWMYQRLVDDSPEATVVADAEGVIQYWNASAETLFGHSAAEAVGKTLDLIIPEPQRQRHWAGYREVMRSGQTRYGRDLLAVPALHKDGARLSIEFHVVLLRDATGRITAIAALIRDVTARWERDRALQHRLRALEADLATSGATREEGAP
jgi:PAS domain S-box-containing protein